MTNSPLFVLDTNTIVSAVLLPHSIPRQVFNRTFVIGRVLASEATLDELDEVLRRPKFNRYLDENDRLHFLAMYIHNVQIIEVNVSITACRDVKDNKFLELAVSGEATCIVSGDNDLLDLTQYQGIAILKSSDFLIKYK